MAVRWNSEFFTAMEYRDLQANAMAVDNTGTYVLLAGYVNQNFILDVNWGILQASVYCIKEFG